MVSGKRRGAVRSKKGLKTGDLVRVCTDVEASSIPHEEIDWCYGIYLGKKEDPLSKGFGWAPTECDRVLYNGSVMMCDHYWHIERIS